jgi:RND family efflux transporter MFP subunit
MSGARGRLRLVACALTCAALSVPGRAAQPSAEFAISASQMRSLGVTVHKLDQPGAVPQLAAPARVVLAPDGDVMVSAPLDGVVDRLLVKPYDAVKAGQPLLKLASPVFGGLQLRLMEASAQAKLSRQALVREKQLFAEGIIPERRVQETQVANATAAAAVRQAEAELRLAGADAAAIRGAAAGGRLADTLVVRAARDGIVSTLDAKPGQRVQAADPLLRIADLRELWLEVQVPAGTRVASGTAITVVGREVAAAVQSVGTLVGESQTVNVRARVTSGAARLRPGEAVEARVPVAAAAGWTLPLQAVTHYGRQAYVFVRSPKGFVATPVTVVSSAGPSARVDGRLNAGQEVAIGAVIALKSAWLGLGGSD